MSGTEISKLNLARTAVWIASRDFTYFTQFLRTRDEATGKTRPWPKEYEYVKVVQREIFNHEVLWLKKSRRTMMTWTMCAYLLWRALFDEVFLGVLQSLTERKSAEHLRDKIRFAYNSLPRWFRSTLFGTEEPEFTTLEHRFPNGNAIRGVAQGSDVARGDTPSVVVVDECAFQPEFRAALTALLPLVEKQTQLILVSSTGPGVFSDVTTSEIDGDVTELLSGNADLPAHHRQGVRIWRLRHGGTVLRVHFSADPEKTPEWLDKQDKKYAGGIDGPDFRREMGIEDEAFHGTRVYKSFVDRPPHVQVFEIPPGAPKWLSGDYGLRHPTAIIEVCELGQNEHGPIYGVYQELQESDLSVEQVKQLIWTQFGPPEKYERELIDPSTDALREAETKTPFWLFNNGKYARSFSKANNNQDGIVLIREWLAQSRLVIHPQCRHLIWQMLHYRYQEWSEKVGLNHDPKAKVVKKRDDLVDALKYFANEVRLSELPDPEEVELVNPMEEILAEINSYRPWYNTARQDYTREQIARRG